MRPPVPCMGCGAPFPQQERPTQRSVESTPGCWEAFGQVLAREARLGALTVAEVLKARTPEEHKQAVWAWARDVWSAWSPHHETVRRWLPPGRMSLRW